MTGFFSWLVGGSSKPKAIKVNITPAMRRRMDFLAKHAKENPEFPKKVIETCTTILKNHYISIKVGRDFTRHTNELPLGWSDIFAYLQLRKKVFNEEQDPEVLTLCLTVNDKGELKVLILVRDMSPSTNPRERKFLDLLAGNLKSFGYEVEVKKGSWNGLLKSMQAST